MTKKAIGIAFSAIMLAGALAVSGSASAAESVMKQCAAEWKAAKAAGTTNGQKWNDFRKTCEAQKAGSAAPAAAPAPAATTAAPAPAPAATAAPAKPKKTTAAVSAAGQFANEAEAKAKCPTDTVVWVNTHSHKYHYAGHPDYGTTKKGAYMCEADAKTAGDVAAKGEKPK